MKICRECLHICVFIRLSRCVKICLLFSVDDRQQDDIIEFSHDLWTQPFTQAEELRQRVCGPEFSPRGGEYSDHRRGPADDQCIRHIIYGKPSLLQTESYSSNDKQLLLCLRQVLVLNS